MFNSRQQDALVHGLNNFQIELPSWGFANTGTRFGKFLQPAAASTIEEKFADAAEVHRYTGVCPSIALHVLWDLSDVSAVERLVSQYGIRAGSINPNVFEEQIYKYGSLGNPDPAVREAALRHILDSVAIAKRLHSRDLSLWFADGSNYPGTQDIRRRKQWFEEGLQEVHAGLSDQQPDRQRMLVEYKPFEPAFYHTDIADWGMALHFARSAGPRAKVLVDTGHHYQAQNIEQIVAWLLDLDMLGGFHFNDRRYADDDLTLGSIDPYQVFRIFHEIQQYEWEAGKRADIAFMIDQSHNLKGKMEAMIQTVTTALELWAKAALVDRESLAVAQQHCALIDAENCLKDAYSSDVRPLIAEWMQSRNLPADPLDAFRESGYLERITKERSGRNSSTSSGYA